MGVVTDRDREDRDVTDTEVKPSRPAGKSPSALRRRHLKFKAHAAAVLLREAKRRNPCSTFEQTMVKVGLNAIRPDQGYDKVKVRVVGESTVEAFERWRRKTSRYLMLMGVEHGYRHAEHLAILREAGFDTEKAELVPIKVRITIEVPHRVQVFPSDGPGSVGEKLSAEQVRQIAYRKFSSSATNMTWEVARA